jgi:hypothetical protein
MLTSARLCLKNALSSSMRNALREVVEVAAGG